MRTLGHTATRCSRSRCSLKARRISQTGAVGLGGELAQLLERAESGTCTDMTRVSMLAMPKTIATRRLRVGVRSRSVASLLLAVKLAALDRHNAELMAKIALETSAETPLSLSPGATLGGDRRALRGVPCVGRGIRGAVAGLGAA